MHRPHRTRPGIDRSDLGIEELDRGDDPLRPVTADHFERPLGVDPGHAVGVGEFPRADEAVVARRAFQVHPKEDLRDPLLLARMQEALARVLNEPEVKNRIEDQGCDVVASSAEVCRRFLAAEIEKWGQVIRANDIRADS